MTEPVVVWCGDHHGDYDALDSDLRFIGSAKRVPDSEACLCRYEVSDPDGRVVLGMLVATRSSGLPHSILAPDDTPVATIEQARLRFRVQRAIVAGDAVIGSVQERRLVARAFRTVVADPAGRRIGVSAPLLRDSLGVGYVVEIDDAAAPALRSVAVAAAILDDWTRWMYEPGG